MCHVGSVFGVDMIHFDIKVQLINVEINFFLFSGGSKAMLLRPISDQELAEDADHPQLMQRLTALREVSTVDIAIVKDCVIFAFFFY